MRRRALLAAPVLALAARTAWAQSWPARPVRVIIPFPPGGGIDILVRAVGAELSSRWGQPVVVENRAGASGIIGAEAAARSAPDGYTLLGTVNQTFTTNRFLFRTLPYDPDKGSTGEQGYPYIRASIWYGLFAPAGTPDEVVQRIGKDVREVLNTPAFTQAQVTNRGLDLVASDGPALAREIRDETASVGEIIHAARIEPQ
ncbi:Bug family tripartite tricarboxylate transporter substrate binding protein [Roseomonas chloroacetimidivorans]|uniref:Bug family tripartite tricarboxylate transporter substrate binding protein n=1 Tax=Roseomonas chloroacetimidivorans TaxID=1766656 RepID=UPI003C75E9A3